MTEFNPLTPEFVPWPKISRLNRDIVVTEKIDGTNAAIGILDDGTVYAQSRKALITPEKDNFGFARWVAENEDELRVLLGPGLHFGEWWGRGIQRGYGVERKIFSLFNTNRWENLVVDSDLALTVVPVLYEGPFSEAAIKDALARLAQNGSLAAYREINETNQKLTAPTFMDPEGVVVFHTAANLCFKVTIKGDEKPKGSTE